MPLRFLRDGKGSYVQYDDEKKYYYDSGTKSISRAIDKALLTHKFPILDTSKWAPKCCGD